MGFLLYKLAKVYPEVFKNEMPMSTFMRLYYTALHNKKERIFFTPSKEDWYLYNDEASYFSIRFLKKDNAVASYGFDLSLVDKLFKELN